MAVPYRACRIRGTNFGRAIRTNRTWSLGKRGSEGFRLKHPLHCAIAKVVKKHLNGNYEILRDPACGGTHQLPLFVGMRKGRDTRMCCVDLLVVSFGKVRAIIEIEESGFQPTKIFGKFFQSALATHFIHDRQPGQVLPYDRVLFVQVLDGSKCLRKGTRKDKQGELIQRKIRSVLPLEGSGITDYRLFFVQVHGDSAGLHSVGRAVAYHLSPNRLPRRPRIGSGVAVGRHPSAGFGRSAGRYRKTMRRADDKRH